MIFFRFVGFTCIAASNTVSDDVTNKIFNTDIIFLCSFYSKKIDEKFSLNGGFYYDVDS